jgi:uncharacterized protein YfdQ (DUF2303 family)
MSESNSQPIIEALRDLHKTEVLHTIDGVPAIVARPNGITLVDLKTLVDKYRTAPERKTGKTALTTEAAFCDFVNRHKTNHSVIFLNDSNKDAPVLVAVFNAHKSETEAQKPEEAPDWQDFLATYAYPLSDEWKAWKAASSKEMSQAQFADFLEDRILDVGTPGTFVTEYAQEIGVALATTPARLLELSRSLAISAEQKVTQNVNRGTGEATLSFSEEHKDSTGAPVKVPGAFALNIPAFRGSKPTQVPVRLRYKLVKNAEGAGKITWTITPQRLDKVLEAELKDSEAFVAQKTGLKVFRGAP